ncbi:MAG: type II secretion system F family protein [Alphaproteobacteria bacterium]|nr:type II secretion system F family protein [Alphaproteobacteria bacterium]
MFDILTRLPPEIAGMVTLMIAALATLAWKMYQMMHGPRARIRRRLAVITRTRSGGEPGGHPRTGRSPKRKSVQARLKIMEDTRNQERGYKLREQLRLAGLNIELGPYVAASAGLTLLLWGVVKLAGLSWMEALLSAIIVGVGLPRLVIGSLARRRVLKFGSQFADGIDIIIRGVRSGLPLGECLNIVGREMPEPLGAEFRSILEAQKMGMSLQDAVMRMVVRMPIAELRYFSIVIAIQQQTGGNLADTLGKLSEVLRARKRMRDKVQAYASEARASAYIIGSLPFVVILALAALAPQYIGILFTTDTGKALLFTGALTEVTGLLVMRKMIHFDM